MPTQVTQFPLDYHRNSIDKPSKQPSSFFIFLVFISSQRRQDTTALIQLHLKYQKYKDFVHSWLASLQV
jgi:hypothetical protein